MAASIIDFLTDGLVIEFDGTRMSVTVPIHVKDLDTPAGGSPVDLLAEALTVAGMPEPGDGLLISGRNVYARRYRIGAWANADAEVIVTYVEDDSAIGGTGAIIEGGSTLEQSETDFESAERRKPWAERTPMSVLWDPSSDGAPTAAAEEQAVRLPYFAGKPYRRYIKTLSEDPSALAEQFVGAVNNAVWKGYPVESVLCMSITFQNAGEGFRTTFDFAIDRDTRWRQIGRARDRTTGEFVTITNVQLANYNGAKDFVVQLVENFDNLPV